MHEAGPSLSLRARSGTVSASRMERSQALRHRARSRALLSLCGSTTESCDHHHPRWGLKEGAALPVEPSAIARRTLGNSRSLDVDAFDDHARRAVELQTARFVQISDLHDSDLRLDVELSSYGLHRRKRLSPRLATAGSIDDDLKRRRAGDCSYWQCRRRQQRNDPGDQSHTGSQAPLNGRFHHVAWLTAQVYT